MVFSDFSRLLYRPFNFSIALSKGAKTTTWIWNLHSSAHDFALSQQSSTSAVTRKVFSSNLAHLALLFFFLGGLHFHGAYFSNYCAWLKDARHCNPSAHLLWSLVGQDILNSDVGGYFQGIYITSGIFQLWRAQGLVTQVHLKYASAGSLIGTIISLTAAYFHMHSFYSSSFTSLRRAHHLIALFVLLGLGSMAWSGHCIHIAYPTNGLLDAAVDPAVIPCPQDLLLRNPSEILFGYSQPSSQPITERLLNPGTASLFIGVSSAHHFYLAVVFIISGLIALQSRRVGGNLVAICYEPATPHLSHLSLSINLFFFALSSILFAHHVYALPVYPYLSPDFPTVLSLVYHHIIIGGFLIIGAFTHASIFIIRDHLTESIMVSVLNGRDVVIGWLIYLGIALGLHSFGLYIHNDTLSALGREEDMFQDNAIQLKPVFAIFCQSCLRILSFDTEVLCLHEKVVLMSVELGTADFMVYHIHAFTIHITLLVCMKGILYASGSRLVSSKLELGWLYPCDGPGRGGTCQISPYDHLYLAAFWAYNSVSVILFHYFWKMQSDVWGTYEISTIPQHKLGHYLSCKHISAGDFSVNSGTINGWLRNFLWAEAAQVIQSYGTSISCFGLIFLLQHFIWAFSLMFLYSGRGYWQELIESILWAHHKLKIVNSIQPRALSISQGRAVGLIHYIFGGIGCTFAFVISRMLALS